MAVDLGLPLQKAVELPRVHPEGDVLDCEGGIPAATLDALEAAGDRLVRWPDLNIYYGGAQVVAHTAAGPLTVRFSGPFGPWNMSVLVPG